MTENKPYIVVKMEAKTEDEMVPIVVKNRENWIGYYKPQKATDRTASRLQHFLEQETEPDF